MYFQNNKNIIGFDINVKIAFAITVFIIEII